MSASLPEMAFWVIFPLAALIVVSGWVMIIISAVKKLRTGKHREENNPLGDPSQDDPFLHQSNWTPADGIVGDGAPFVPLN